LSTHPSIPFHTIDHKQQARSSFNCSLTTVLTALPWYIRHAEGTAIADWPSANMQWRDSHDDFLVFANATMDIPLEGGESSTRRATNSYSTEEWKRKRSLITKLYFEEGKTLKEVRSILENEHDFKPT
jgi:hypothetical protein